MRRASSVARSGAAVMMVLLGPSLSFAAFTPVGAPAPGEDSVQQILSTVYGGTFTSTGTDGLDFTNQTVTATRIEDTSDVSPTTVTNQPGPIGGTDQLWQGDFTSITAKAIFALYDQNFGYFDGSSGGTYHDLLDPTGKNYALSNSANLTGSNISGIFRWARTGEGADRVFTSQNSDNADGGVDHLVTYQITGLGDGYYTWVLFWEDEFSEYSDFDYNDLVVEVKALDPVAVPEPALLAPASAACALILSRRRRVVA